MTVDPGGTPVSAAPSAPASAPSPPSPDTPPRGTPRGWRRLLPRSLYGRLVAVFIVGLVLAQGLSAWINFAERDRLMLHAAGLQPAQRVADIVHLLDSLDATERARIVAILNMPPQRVTLDRAPMADDPAGRNLSVHAVMFTALLRTALGDDRPLRVAAHGVGGGGPADDIPWPAHHQAMLDHLGEMAGMGAPDDGTEGFGRRGPRRPRPPPGAGLALVTQVQLAGGDGQWVTFDTRLPRASASLPVRLLLTLVVLLAAVLALSFIAVRWLSRPLATLAAAAEALGRNIHRPPLAEDGPTELRQAARAFNTMQARLVRTIEDRTHVLAAMSHDLKTPLTRLRLRAELLDDPDLRQRIEKDLAEMQDMVSSSLAALRGLDAPPQSAPVDVLALLESLQADHQEMGRHIELTVRAGRPLAGDAARLRRCVGNLIDNAVLYGQRARIAVSDSPTQLQISVCDDGPGIPPELLERVFDPYFRVEGSRNRDTGGHGLGLGIARNIARAAGGGLTLHNHPAGGLEALLLLPR